MKTSVRRQKMLQAAQGYLELSMPEHALRELDRIPDPERCIAEYHRLKGESQRQLSQFSQALKSYNRALAESPADIVVLMGMSWCYKRIGRVGQAIAATEQAYRLATGGQRAVLLYNLACYYALAGDKVQALCRLGRAVRMDSQLRQLIDNEPDFDRIRDDPDFRLIAELPVP